MLASLARIERETELARAWAAEALECQDKYVDGQIKKGRSAVKKVERLRSAKSPLIRLAILSQPTVLALSEAAARANKELRSKEWKKNKVADLNEEVLNVLATASIFGFSTQGHVSGINVRRNGSRILSIEGNIGG